MADFVFDLGTAVLGVTVRPVQALRAHLCVLRETDVAKERRVSSLIGRAGSHLSEM